MRSIESRFGKFIERPGASTIIAFAMAVDKQGFNQDRIRRSFNKLVDKNDYMRSDKVELLKFMYNLSKKS